MNTFLKKLIAQSKEEVGHKLIDFFSIAHLLSGFICFGLSFLFMRYSLGIEHVFCTIISVIVVFYAALFWEMFENLSKIGLLIKYSKEQDRLANSLSDIFFTSLGSILAFFLLECFFPVLVFLTILLIVARYINF